MCQWLTWVTENIINVLGFKNYPLPFHNAKNGIQCEKTSLRYCLCKILLFFQHNQFCGQCMQVFVRPPEYSNRRDCWGSNPRPKVEVKWGWHESSIRQKMRANSLCSIYWVLVGISWHWRKSEFCPHAGLPWIRLFLTSISIAVICARSGLALPCLKKKERTAQD